MRGFTGSGVTRGYIFFRKISVVRAGGFLVLEPNFHLGRAKVRWERLLLFFGLTAALAILSSCGSSSTTVPPSITASCISNQGTGGDVTVLSTAQCTATVLNESSTLVNWSVAVTNGGSGSPGTITSGGVYTAPATPPVNTVTITATSQVASTLTATASLTIEAATVITAVVCNDSSGTSPSPLITSSLNPLSCTAYASVTTGTTVPVNWTVTNTSNPSDTLNVGSIDFNGKYIAQPVPPPGQSVTITATSQELATETMSVTATVVFDNGVLSGSYAFSTSGRLPTNVFWARAGRFTAGGGSLSGFEDTNQGGTPNTVNNNTSNTVPPTPRTITGAYSIGPDGRGTMQFCEDTSLPCTLGSPAATDSFRLVVISAQQAQMIEFSSPTATSATTIAGGEMISQDQSVTTNPGAGILSGTYSFNFSGVSTGATEESALGEFAANGHTAISAGRFTAPLAPGEIEINPTSVSSPTALAPTSYSIDSNGLGIVTLGGLTFRFYPVSTSRMKFIEIDTASSATPTTPASILTGDAYVQQTSSTCAWVVNNALNGATVLETSGASSGVVIGDVGSFTATNGAVTAASIDENNGGTVSSAVGTLSGSYTMDPCGRGTLAIGSHSYVFYIISASDAVLQEITSGVIAHGFLVPSQGGPFVDGTLTGSYAFRLGGTNAAGTAGQREDFLGQLTSDGKGNVTTGSLDINSFGTTQTGLAITDGLYAPAPAGSLRATMTLPLAAPNSTRNLVLYMVSPTLFYALDTDSTGTAIGTINNQF